MSYKPRILIVEDDTTQREIIQDILQTNGYEVTCCASGKQALVLLKEQHTDILLTDLRMPEMDGLQLLLAAKRTSPETEVIVMTAYATVNTAVKAMKDGACDYLAKPFDKDELLVVVDRAWEAVSLRRENARLRQLVTESISPENIVGTCPAMQRVFEVIRRAIPLKTTVLIQGESGTGKDLVARHIHFSGPRKDKPFIVVNCAAIPESLIESELFGHEKGAFTGADSTRIGKFEAAHTGTIFLDEIGDMRAESQAKLLRVLQDGTVERIGATQSRKVDVRVIAATNRDLNKLVENGAFRQDLYYRLDVLPIFLPPLRERLEDLPLLLFHLRKKIAQKLERPVPDLAPEVLDAMKRYNWPGNVRELENVLEQTMILCDKDTITLADMPERFRQPNPQTSGFVLPPQGLVMEDLERDLIQQALERTRGKIADAAKLLGISYKTLQYRIKKHGILAQDEPDEA